MEPHKEGLDKMLESLEPALSTDLTRILETARRELEDEFHKRLEAVVREAQAAATGVSESQQQQLVEKAREELSAELKADFEKTLAQTRQQLEAEFDQKMRVGEQQWNSEKNRLQEQVNLWRTYAEAQRQMADGRSQVDVLSHFLDRVEAFAPAVALYVAKADGLELWKTRGNAAFPKAISQSTIDPDAYFRPIVIRDKSVAAVCARPPFKRESLDFLVACLAHAVEMIGMRLQNRGNSKAAAS
jgi:hypothetical protein